MLSIGSTGPGIRSGSDFGGFDDCADDALVSAAGFDVIFRRKHVRLLLLRVRVVLLCLPGG